MQVLGEFVPVFAGDTWRHWQVRFISPNKRKGRTLVPSNSVYDYIGDVIRRTVGHVTSINFILSEEHLGKGSLKLTYQYATVEANNEVFFFYEVESFKLGDDLGICRRVLHNKGFKNRNLWVKLDPVIAPRITPKSTFRVEGRVGHVPV